MNRIKGVMAVVPTPLNIDETPDFDGIETLVNFLVDNNMGMFALGSAGEGMNIPFQDRVAIARKMAEVNDGRQPLLIGAGSFSVREALQFIEALGEAKVDGVHVIPYDKKISGNAVEALYTDIADRSHIPVWLYQNITRTSGIPLDVVGRLREHENIKGCKVAGFDLRLNQSFLAMDREDFQVLGSADGQFFSFMCLGTASSTTSTAACFPEMMTDLYETIQADSLKAARERNKEVMSFFKRIPKTAYGDNGESSAEIKYMLKLRGICQEHCARPFRAMNSEERKAAEIVYEDYLHYLETREIKLG